MPLILGFGIPFAVFYVMKVLDTTVKSRNDLNKLSVPFLAELPQMASPRITGNVSASTALTARTTRSSSSTASATPSMRLSVSSVRIWTS
jgi:hypothetical protein